MSKLEIENIKGHRQLAAGEEMQKGVLWVDPKFMDVNKPLTIVEKNDENIIGFYEDARHEITGDLLFPGLEVSNLGSALSAPRLNFVLPTGEAIFIDFSDVNEFAGSIEEKYKNVTDRLNQVKDWYDQKDETTGLTNRERSNLSVFKYLGQRADRTAGEGDVAKFDHTNFHDINTELKKVNYEIRVHRDLGAAVEENSKQVLKKTATGVVFGMYGMLYEGFKAVTGDEDSMIADITRAGQEGEVYTIVDLNTNEVVHTSFDANETQAYLWNNLDKDKINMLKASASESLNEQLEKQVAQEKEIFHKQDESKQQTILKDMVNKPAYWKEMEYRVKSPKSPLTADLDQTQKGALWKFIESTVTTRQYEHRSTSGDLISDKWSPGAAPADQPLPILDNVTNNLKIQALIDLLDPDPNRLPGQSSPSNFYTEPKEGRSYQTGGAYETRAHTVTTADFSILEKAGISKDRALAILQTLSTVGEENSIISDSDFLNERQNVAAEQYSQNVIGVLMMQRDRDGGYIVNPDYKGEFNAMALISAIEEIKRGDEYARLSLRGSVGELTLKGQTFFGSKAPGVNSDKEVINYLDASYDQLFKEYERAESFIIEANKEDNETLLQQIKDAGLGYETNDDDQLVVIGYDQDKVNTFKTKWNNNQLAQLSLAEKYMD